ncbi:MAG: MobC family plasmid mobilization relaxosome protein [Chryseobacterium sp.]|nr:MAG: MobC family plasmid mobilization relaxosome protein [Chryseobacterium sp.]
MDHRKGETKTRRFELRLSEEELLQFLDLEKSIGISRADIVRIRVLKNSTKMLVNSKELMGRLDEIGTELGRAGNNINQLARHANVLNKKEMLATGTFADLTSLMSSYIDVQRELEKILRQLIRLMRG